MLVLVALAKCAEEGRPGAAGVDRKRAETTHWFLPRRRAYSYSSRVSSCLGVVRLFVGGKKSMTTGNFDSVFQIDFTS